MSQKIIDKCPSCGEDLSISSLKCNSCGIEIKGDFEIPKIDYNPFSELDDNDINFIKLFLKYEGNITSIQRELGTGYMVVKARLRLINRKLNNDELGEYEKKGFPYDTSRFGKASKTIAEKLRFEGGSASCPMLRGEPMTIWLTEKGVLNSAFPGFLCEWRIFDAIISETIRLGGRMAKGDSAAQNGARIGSEELPLKTMDSFISIMFYGKKKGETTLRRSTYYAAILAWAGICINTRSSNGEGGYIILDPDWCRDNVDPYELHRGNANVLKDKSNT